MVSEGILTTADCGTQRHDYYKPVVTPLARRRRFYREAKILESGEGVSEGQLVMIARGQVAAGSFRGTSGWNSCPELKEEKWG